MLRDRRSQRGARELGGIRRVHVVGNSEDEVRIYVQVALVQVDDAGPSGERFSRTQRQFDAVLPGFELECEAARGARDFTLPFARVNVDRLDCPSLDGGSTPRCPYSSADGAVRLGRSRTGSMTGTPGRQPLNVESPARMNTVAKAQKTDTRPRHDSAGCNRMSDALAYGWGVTEDDSASRSYRDDRQLATPHPDADSRSDGAEKHQKGRACHHNSLWPVLNATSVPEDGDTVEVLLPID